MDGIKLYFWFRGVDEGRDGGPWWCRTFISAPYESAYAQRAHFLETLLPFLYAYAATDGTEPQSSSPPPGAVRRFFRKEEAP